MFGNLYSEVWVTPWKCLHFTVKIDSSALKIKEDSHAAAHANDLTRHTSQLLLENCKIRITQENIFLWTKKKRLHCLNLYTGIRKSGEKCFYLLLMSFLDVYFRAGRKKTDAEVWCWWRPFLFHVGWGSFISPVRGHSEAPLTSWTAAHQQSLAQCGSLEAPLDRCQALTFREEIVHEGRALVNACCRKPVVNEAGGVKWTSSEGSSLSNLCQCSRGIVHKADLIVLSCTAEGF